MCFHSISFPNEWGATTTVPTVAVAPGFHSISFPNEWGEVMVEIFKAAYKQDGEGFHSISFPNEWGGEGVATRTNGTVFPFN
jgi:hypothetical protein